MESFLEPDNIALLTGWGATTGNSPYVVTANLKGVQMPIISNNDANTFNSPSILEVTANMIAFFQSGSGAAPGDSGGPAILNVNGKPILIGASSWGLTPKDQRPTIYTRIRNYSNWIRNNSGVDFFLLDIVGSSQICNTSETYSIPNLPAGSTVNWTINPSYLVSSSSSGNSITLNKIYEGIITLSATVNGVCGNINLQPTTIRVGAPVLGMPNFTNLDNENPYWCSNNSGNSFTVETNDLSVTYEARLLSYPSLNVYATNSNAYPGSDAFGYVPAGYYVFQLRATNNCGTSDWVETEVESLDCSMNYRGSNFNIYPNPANTELTIEIANKTGNKNKDIQLLNNKGEILISSLLKSGEAKLVLDTKGIEDGTYFLHITEGKETLKKQIIIKH